MGLYTRACSSVLFPLHERLKGHSSVAWRQRLERSQWLPREAIQAQQVRHLRDFLVDVGREVPYYQELFKERRFDPHSLRSVTDLSQLPPLTKADIRAQGDRMRANNHGPLSRYNTGGSSGEPLVFYIGKARKSHDVAAKWRATRWWNVDIGDCEAVIWGSPIEHGAQDRVRQLRDGLFRSHLMPAFEMSEPKLDGFVTSLRRLRPRMLFGYPSALTYIARHAARRGVTLNDLGVRVAFVTSERLYDEQRSTIESTFGCPVANGYGGRDAGFIAHQCPAGGMHISAEDIVVEILDSQGQVLPAGQLGEVVVTHLATRDFPFIRYRTGDVAMLDTVACACGRGLPLLRDLQGRTTDFVMAADGTVMHGLALIYVVRDLPGIERFKITQETLNHLRVELVPGPSFDPAVVPGMVAALRQRLGAQVQVDVDRVEHIAPERSGKYRYIVSKVVGSR